MLLLDLGSTFVLVLVLVVLAPLGYALMRCGVVDRARGVLALDVSANISRLD